jgi:hypothetical protein
MVDLGVRQALGGGWSVLGRAGRSYRFANIDEIYGTTTAFTRQFQFLRPQVANGGEVGLDYTTPTVGARLALHRPGQGRVTLDEVIETMRQTGVDMSHKYKETSQGGLAVNVVEC